MHFDPRYASSTFWGSSRLHHILASQLLLALSNTTLAWSPGSVVSAVVAIGRRREPRAIPARRSHALQPQIPNWIPIPFTSPSKLSRPSLPLLCDSPSRATRTPHITGIAKMANARREWLSLRSIERTALWRSTPPDLDGSDTAAFAVRRDGMLTGQRCGSSWLRNPVDGGRGASRTSRGSGRLDGRVVDLAKWW
jgi:hypothetical protein